MSIKLFTDPNGSAYESFAESNTDLKAEATFKKAVVTTGTWIFYTLANYNAQNFGGTAANIKVLKEGDQGDITNVNGSMYLVPNATEGFVLFDHGYYGGARQYFHEECSDINKAFSNSKLGITSVIILSHDEDYQAFEKTNYQGVQVMLQRNKWYPVPSSMGIPNDAMKSIRKA